MQFSEKLEEGFRSFWNGTIDRWSREVQKWVVPYSKDWNGEASSSKSGTESGDIQAEQEENIELWRVSQRLFKQPEKNKDQCGDQTFLSECTELSANSFVELEVDTVLDSLDFETEEEKESLRSKMVMINRVFHEELEDLRKQHRRLKAEQMLRVYLNSAGKEEEPVDNIFEYLFKTITNRPTKFHIDSKVCRKIVEELLLMDELERVLVSLEKQSIELDHLICDLELEVHDRILSACKPKVKGLSSSVDSFTKRMHEEGGLKYINKEEQETLLAYSSLPPPLSKDNIHILRRFQNGVHDSSNLILPGGFISTSSPSLEIARNGQTSYETLDTGNNNESADKNAFCPSCPKHNKTPQKETASSKKKCNEALITDLDSRYYSNKITASVLHRQESCNDASSNLVGEKNIKMSPDVNKVSCNSDYREDEKVRKGYENRTDVLNKARLIFMLGRDSGISLTVDESGSDASVVMEAVDSSRVSQNTSSEQILVDKGVRSDFAETSSSWKAIENGIQLDPKATGKLEAGESPRDQYDDEANGDDKSKYDRKPMSNQNYSTLNKQQFLDKPNLLQGSDGKEGGGVSEIENVLGLRNASAEEVEADRLPII